MDADIIVTENSQTMISLGAGKCYPFLSPLFLLVFLFCGFVLMTVNGTGAPLLLGQNIWELFILFAAKGHEIMACKCASLAPENDNLLIWLLHLLLSGLDVCKWSRA